MQKKVKVSSGVIARVGVLGAIAAILFYFPEIPVIAFYKLDFSNLPALLGGFAMGPMAGFVIVLIKDLFGLLHSSTAFVGELADLLMSGAFVVVASLLYRHRKSRKSALIGMVLGTIAMTIVGALANYYIMIPFYIGQFGMPEEAIIGMVSATIPACDSISKVILMVTVPFNVFKGAVISGITMLLYKRLSPLLHDKKA